MRFLKKVRQAFAEESILEWAVFVCIGLVIVILLYEQLSGSSAVSQEWTACVGGWLSFNETSIAWKYIEDGVYRTVVLC